MTKTKYRKSDYFGYVWLAPAFVLMCIFSIYPALSALYHSFTDWNIYNSSLTVFTGIANFQRLFTDYIFWKSCLNLIILIVTGMIFGNVAALGLAELLHSLKSIKSSSVYRFLFIIPTLVPGMVNMLIWTQIILSSSPIGLMNTILSAFGVETLGWYYSENTAMISMIITGFPWVSGTSFLIYLAGLNNIPDSVYEALELDGAGTWKRIFWIDIPLIKSQIKYFVMMGIIGGMPRRSALSSLP